MFLQWFESHYVDSSIQHMDLIFLQKQDCTFSFHANTSLKYPFNVTEPSEYTITPHPVYQTPGPARPLGGASVSPTQKQPPSPSYH